jgi:hypothetical protein
LYSTDDGVRTEGPPIPVALRFVGEDQDNCENMTALFRASGGFMPICVRLVIVLLLAIGTAGALDAQITSNPIPAPIVKRGISVEVTDLVRLPDTRGIRPADQDVSPAGWARVNYVRDLPDGRRFANDSRGFLYLIDGRNQPHVYANVAELFPHAV